LSEYYGYAGKILYVDLSTGSIRTESLNRGWIRDFIGGMGINVRLAYDLIKPGMDPLGPENPVIIGAGPLTGTVAPSATKVTVTFKQPLNSAIGTAVGCGFAPMLKWAGYDHIVITGSAEKPVYLKIFDDEVEICDATELWGLDIYEATDAIRRKEGRDVSVICMGRAGENLVKTSLCLIDKVSHIGRGGLGAVFGAKKLKAIVVRGTRGVKIADVEEATKLFKSIMKDRVYTDRRREVWIRYGLMGVVERWYDAHLVPSRNKRYVHPPEKLKRKFGVKTFDEYLDIHPCGGPSCPIPDKGIYVVKKGKHKGMKFTASVPINPFICFGIPFDLEDPTDAFKIHAAWNRHGLDELEAPLIELVFELYNEGVVKKEDLGIELKPDPETILKITEKIVNKEGFWGVVADGVPAIISKVGEEAEKRAIHIKGMCPPFDARSCLGVEAFHQVVDPRGPLTGSGLVRSPSTAIPGISTSLVKSLYTDWYMVPPEAADRIFENERWNVARMTVYVENVNTLFNCLGLCTRFFIARCYSPRDAHAFYKAVTGVDISLADFVKAGERVWNLYKMLNVREGFTREHDKWPSRWVREAIKHEKGEVYLQDYTKSRRLSEKDVEQLLDDYYDERGWNVELGIPTREKLQELGLDFAVKDLPP